MNYVQGLTPSKGELLQAARQAHVDHRDNRVVTPKCTNALRVAIQAAMSDGKSCSANHLVSAVRRLDICWFEVLMDEAMSCMLATAFAARHLKTKACFLDTL